MLFEVRCFYIDNVLLSIVWQLLLMHGKRHLGRSLEPAGRLTHLGTQLCKATCLEQSKGFDSVHFVRIDYQDRAKRKGYKSLQIFANAFPVHYSPPDGFGFEIFDDIIPVQANVTRTSHIMWTMGDDFQYQHAESWFINMDKLIHYVNKDGQVDALYSNPSHYADVARQLDFLIRNTANAVYTSSLEDSLAVAQHRDAVSRTAQQHTTDDYANCFSIGATLAGRGVDVGLTCLTSGCKPCSSSDSALSQVVATYNPLGWHRTDFIRIPASNTTMLSCFYSQTVRSGSLPKLAYLEDGTIEVGPGQLQKITNPMTGVDQPIQQNYLLYSSSAGDASDQQASGAYIFLPNGTVANSASSSRYGVPY
ncbi:Alpha-mannosidase [Rhynchospora pubera]|uniref:Alpha-mannosidase n=1 Tax=Rhynchospora pubera TaxID=906938 RepID=A0AAV8DMR0_9POAL|nr:Alpha-mannosidase [Rhynchospora pubera]